jgi:peptidoglycan/LPS O-acetylase OafA/YrhL
VLAGAASWLADREWYRRLLASPLFALVPLGVLVCNAFDRYPSFYFTIGMTARNLGIAAIVHWSILRSNRLAAAMLDSRPFRAVGRISYSLYLWQQPFLNRHQASMLAAFPVNITLAVVCAILSFTLVEAPALRLRERLRQRTRPAPLTVISLARAPAAAPHN